MTTANAILAALHPLGPAIEARMREVAMNETPLQICGLCKAWRDCWTAPNGEYLCDDCVSAFGLRFCDNCNELAALHRQRKARSTVAVQSGTVMGVVA